MAGVLSRKGVNAQRRVHSDGHNRDDEHLDLVSATAPRMFLRAVVLDVVYDPVAMADELSKKYGDAVGPPNLQNVRLLRTAPHNSIIARVISAGIDRRIQTPSIFYPTLSHTHEPIKPGEQAWVFYEDPEGATDQGFWLSRVKEPLDIDDPNFTHGDRKHAPSDGGKSTFDRLEDSKALDGLDPAARTRLQAASGAGPSFPNGADTDDTFSLNEVDAYEAIEEGAIGNRVSTREPVPRYSKRPQDWTAEGSNNSLLVLGEDRTGAASRASGDGITSRPDGDRTSGAGMFDLVVGRGLGSKGKLPAPGEAPTGTAPAVIKNARGLLETDKELDRAPAREGDPDFMNDAARIYGAMDTDVDKNFGVTGNIPVLNAGTVPDAVDDGAAIIAKTDHVRVISRKDGSIRIIKEGDQDTSRAVILIEKDGTIMIDGPTIILGSGNPTTGHGKGRQVFVGRDAHESMVLGDTLKSVLDQFASDVQVACLNLNAAVGAFTTLGNFGIPIPDLAALKVAVATFAAGDMKKATQGLQASTESTLSEVGKTL